MSVEELFAKALAYSNSGNHNNALDYYNKVTDLAPLAYGAWMNKGILYEMFNDFDEAIKCYDNVIGIKPNFIPACLNLGILYFNKKKYHRAKFWLKIAIDAGHNESQLLMAYQICLNASEIDNMVFVSYSQHNFKFVNEILIPYLNMNSVEHFIDQAKIPQNSEFKELRWQIEQGIAQCDSTLLVWSSYSAESAWVKTELCSTIGMLKNIYFVIIDDTPIPVEILTGVSHEKIRLYFWENPYDKKKLIEDLVGYLSWSFEVDNMNSNVHSVILSYEDLKFEWVQLHGGILHDFCIGKYPITQEQWAKVMEYNPSIFKGDSSRPVENISWNEIQQFTSKLSNYFKTEIRLPTDIEWEFACRAGSTGNWCFGNDEDKLYDYAWCIDNSGIGMTPGFAYGYVSEEGRPSKYLSIETSPSYTNSVNSKMPNKWGIYHMHGNVWEWCQDSIFNDSKKNCRGGSFQCIARSMRCASRELRPINGIYKDVGFRICKI